MESADYYRDIETLPLKELLKRYPHAADYLANMRLDHLDASCTFCEALTPEIEEELEEFGLQPGEICGNFVQFLSSFADSGESSYKITSLTILGGQNKLGDAESVELTVRPGEVISIVGPTGSGKSRLLEDIEALAQRDTPTKRQILLNGSVPTDEQRFSLGGKLVAQLSQNMNFVMDITVISFLVMHAKSRMIPDPETAAEKCFAAANTLAGEKFSRDTKVTQLSGGQSRALMISDTALMSSSPIILI
ncbi:MAG TPA: ATP-binding cassette domain-containing protein, partial [Methanocorpusculum sp.]|nr:ATP-binding cassette domain-containing protein [Methanocorpusculum sp.]